MPDISRRTFIAGASLGVAAGIAASAVPAVSPMLAAGSARPGTAVGGADTDLTALGGDVVAHIRDASTGEVAILVGGVERIHHDPSLVARLLRVARQAQSEA